VSKSLVLAIATSHEARGSARGSKGKGRKERKRKKRGHGKSNAKDYLVSENGRKLFGRESERGGMDV